MIVVCSGCFRELPCGCTNPEATHGLPGAILLRLVGKWSTQGGATVPEARWFTATKAELDLDQITIRRSGPRSFNVWVYGASTDQEELVHDALRLIRSSMPSVAMRVLFQERGTGLMAYRTDGRMVCDRCGLEYRMHPDADEVGVAMQWKFLTRICNGELVKL